MMARHYAPRARVIRFRGALPAPPAGPWGALLLSARAPVAALVVQMPMDAAAYGRALYAVLHDIDDAGCDTVFVEDPPEGEDWRAVRDRLARAATPA